MSYLGLRASEAVALIDAASGERCSFADVVERGRDVAARVGAGKRLVFQYTTSSTSLQKKLGVAGGR